MNIQTRPESGKALDPNEIPADVAPTQPLRQTALQLVADGKALIPLYPNSKTPILTAWQHAKLDTAEKVNAMFDAYGECNLAIEPEDEGLCVIDADLYHEGVPERLAELGLPPTQTVTTPRGGKHFYFMGSLRATVGKEDYALGPGIDTRGRGSYVLIPPSVIDGKPYVAENASPAVALPPEIETRVNRRTDAVTAAPDGVRIDDPGNISRARQRLEAHVKRGRVAIEGERGDDTTYEIACELVRDLGISETLAVKLMLEHWYPHCRPNDQPEFVRAKVASAAAYGQNAPGAYASPPAAETFANADLSNYQQPAQSPVESTPKGHILSGASFGSLITRPVPPVEEIIPGLVEKGIATMLAGAGGTHKSRVALQWGLCVQAGKPIYGQQVQQATFVYLDYENGTNEVARRAQKMQWRLDLPKEFPGEHYHDYKEPQKPDEGDLPAYQEVPCLAVVSESGIEVQQFYYDVVETLRSIPGHKFVVMDSCYNVLRFVGQAKVNETAVKTALGMLDYICKITDSTILYIWHPSQTGLERGDATGWSVAWHNTPRARLSLKRDKDAKDVFALKVEKRNNGPTGAEITLHWADGLLVPRQELGLEDQRDRLYEACIEIALQAHERDDHITRNKGLYPWQLDMIEHATGFHPNHKQVKAELERAVANKRLRYIKGHGKTKAGYYPWETDPDTLRTLRYDTATPDDRSAPKGSMMPSGAGSPENSDNDEFPD